MIRQSPSRNQRSKGFKVKHVLQICVLVAACFWLIYQVKHSHDKKKEFDENDAKISLNMLSGNEIFKFGRKDLNPEVKETSKENEKHDEEAEEDTGGGEEEQEQEEDSKTEEKKDEGRGGGDDEVDDHDREKSDSEVDREEDFIDEEKEREEGEEKEREEGDEKEGEEKNVEDKDSQTENENSIEDHDHDGGTRNTHEAREEQYKADDASSAVTHDGQTISTENENGSMENQVNIVEHENEGNNIEESNIGQNTTDLKVHEDETVENGTSTVNEEKNSGVFISASQGSSSPNSTVTSESNDQPELRNNSTEVSTEFQVLPLQNGTEIIISDTSHAQNATGGGTTSAEGSNLQIVSLYQAHNGSTASENSQSDSNSTISIATENVKANPGESSNSSMNSPFVASENTIQSNASAKTKDGSGSMIIEPNADVIQNEKSDTSGGTDGTDESSGSSNTENADEAQHDTIDSSDSSVPLEDKEALIDLDTLPDTRTEGSNIEYDAE